DLLLVARQRVSQRREGGLQLRILVLRGQLLRPVHGQVEVAAAVVDAAQAAGGRLVVVQERAGGRVQRLRQHPRLRVVVALGQVLERGGERQELAQRIPAQVVLGGELLHVLGRRAAGTGLEQPAAGHQRHNR